MLELKSAFPDEAIDLCNGLINGYISKITPEAYKNLHHIANPILARMGTGNNFVKRVREQELHGRKFVFRRNYLLIFIGLVHYYARNLVHFAFFMAHGLCFLASGLWKKKAPLDDCRKVIAIDTFVMVEKILHSKGYRDNYFMDCFQEIQNSGYRSFIVATLFGSKMSNLRDRFHAYRYLLSGEEIFLTEYHMFHASDYLDLFIFLLMNPIRTLSLLECREDDRLDGIFHDEIIRNLHRVRYTDYVRFLLGRRIGQRYGKLQVVSWYENQARDKLFFLGVRSAGNRSWIVGTQFFNMVKLLLNLEPLAAEIDCGVVPDRIVVKGPYFLRKVGGIDYVLGCAPRESYLFDENINAEGIASREGTAVLLTFNVDESKRIISMVRDAFSGRVTVKPHPNHTIGGFYRFPENWVVATGDVKEVCRNSAVVITGVTGASIEAACMGATVVQIGGYYTDASSIFPDIGKGLCWYSAETDKELSGCLEQIRILRKENPEKIIGAIYSLRNALFSKCNESACRILTEDNECLPGEQ
ncbi:MAG: hypothetical protein PHQ23_07845 [Candidatus Wallbacteria bacterium]|nr:hypothetical protein [Candidatus Wallbacteria bacterium]